jgi:hypothetical protein
MNTPSPVTRTELAGAVGDAFGLRATDRTEILATARSAAARAEVMAVLESLPDRGYHDIRQLWPVLPDMPVR